MMLQYSTDSSHSSTRMSRSQSDMQQQQQQQHESQAIAYTDYGKYAHSPQQESPVRSSGVQTQLASSPATDADVTPRKAHTDPSSSSSSPVAPPTAYKTAPRPAQAQTQTQTRTHSRNASGADSVTYKREQDATGKNRWVLERRRTGEGGFVEVVGREVVEGGRI